MILLNIKFHRFYDFENLGYVYFKFYLSNLSYFKDSYLWISLYSKAYTYVLFFCVVCMCLSPQQRANSVEVEDSCGS